MVTALVIAARSLSRRIYRSCFTTCAHCGQGFSFNYNPIEYEGFEQGVARRFLDGERDLLHWGACAGVAGVKLKRRQLEAEYPNRIDVRYEIRFGMYYGCYSWWREMVLHEPHDVAVQRAAEHVQRSTTPCDDCDGEGTILAAGIDPVGDGRREDITWIRVPCDRCDATGYPVAQYQITEAMLA